MRIPWVQMMQGEERIMVKITVIYLNRPLPNKTTRPCCNTQTKSTRFWIKNNSKAGRVRMLVRGLVVVVVVLGNPSKTIKTIRKIGFQSYFAAKITSLTYPSLPPQMPPSPLLPFPQSPPQPPNKTTSRPKTSKQLPSTGPITALRRHLSP